MGRNHFLNHPNINQYIYATSSNLKTTMTSMKFNRPSTHCLLLYLGAEWRNY